MSLLHYATTNANVDLIHFWVESDSSAASNYICTSNPSFVDTIPAMTLLPAIQTLIVALPEIISMMDHDTGYTPLHLLCQGWWVSCAIIQALNEAALKLPKLSSQISICHCIMLECGSLLMAYPQGAESYNTKEQYCLVLGLCDQPIHHREGPSPHPDETRQAHQYGFSVSKYHPYNRQPLLVHMVVSIESRLE